MNRNLYDTDVTVYNPQGRLFQVEYAQEAVNQGSACVGVCSDKFVALAALKRSPSALASYMDKITRVDKHMGVAISGLTADSRTLCRFMRDESLNYRFVFGSPMPTGRLVVDVADKMQECTQTYVRRPYGVGLLVAGYDRAGPHLFEASPSGEYYEYTAQAIGARNQAARTHFEKRVEAGALAALGRDELVLEALRALAATLETGSELTVDNASAAVVGEGTEFTVLDGDTIAPILERLRVEGTGAGAGGAGAVAADDDA